MLNSNRNPSGLRDLKWVFLFTVTCPLIQIFALYLYPHGLENEENLAILNILEKSENFSHWFFPQILKLNSICRCLYLLSVLHKIPAIWRKKNTGKVGKICQSVKTTLCSLCFVYEAMSGTFLWYFQFLYFLATRWRSAGWRVVMIPTRSGKPGKMRKLFPVREKSGKFEQTWKVREFDQKYWKNEDILANFYFSSNLNCVFVK